MIFEDYFLRLLIKEVKVVLTYTLYNFRLILSNYIMLNRN